MFEPILMIAGFAFSLLVAFDFIRPLRGTDPY